MEDENGGKEKEGEESLVCGSEWGRRKYILLLPSLEEEVRELVKMQESGYMLIHTLFDEPGHELVRIVVTKKKKRKDNLNKGHRVATNW